MHPEGIQTNNEPSPEYAAQLLVEQALRHENPRVPDDLWKNVKFKRSLGSEIARLLWREQDNEAEEVVEDLHVPEEVLRSDPVRTAALHERTILESKYPQTIADIIRLMRVFKLSLDDVPEELRTALLSYGHVPAEEQGAA